MSFFYKTGQMATKSGQFLWRNAGASYEPETETLVARFDEAPTTALKDLINTTIKGLKDDGVFALGDCMYVRGVHTAVSACQNWIKNAHNSTLVNATTFTPKVGFQCDGATSYINNNYTPGTEAQNYQLNSATVSLLISTLPTLTGKYIFGCANTTPGLLCYSMYSIRLTNTEYMYFNSNAATNAYANQEAGEHIAYTREGITTQGYIDGAVEGAPRDVAAGVQLPSYPWIEGGAMIKTNLDGLNDTTFNFSFIGGLLTPTQITALYNRIKYFYDNVGGTF